MLATIQEQLGPRLAEGASVTTSASPRWSTYGAPEPVAVVHVKSEEDVATTVKYCNSQNLPFVVQGGGHGWAVFERPQNLVTIDLSQLDSVVVSADKTSATIGGGATVGKTIAGADAGGVILMTGNCNAVGITGALLAGGFGNTMGMFGFAIDNVLEMRVVTADGELTTVSAAKEQDLFWAMRGAGPNFGIVTSTTMKAYAMPQEERSAWRGAIIFTPDKLEQVVQAIQDMELSSNMVSFLYFASSGPPSHSPVVIVTLWMFQGTPETGKAAFKPLYDIGPIVDTTSVLPYTEWNTGADIFCSHSQRKPSFTAAFDKLDAKTARQVWDKYVEFQQKPGAEASCVIVEQYPMNDIRFAGEKEAAFSHRRTRFHVMAIPWYTDPSLDDDAIQYGKEVRELWRNGLHAGNDTTYVNFAHGDETLEEVYGPNLARLQELKQKWDPESRFKPGFNLR